jgi:hypothetical protein
MFLWPVVTFFVGLALVVVAMRVFRRASSNFLKALVITSLPGVVGVSLIFFGSVWTADASVNQAILFGLAIALSIPIVAIVELNRRPR